MLLLISSSALEHYSTPNLTLFFIARCPDECCQDRTLFVRLIREIKDETDVHVYEAAEEDLSDGEPPVQALTLRYKPIVTFAPQVKSAVTTIIEGCAKQGKVLGMDCEWEPSFDGSPERPVCTVQLALPDGRTFLIHLQRAAGIQTTKGSFSTALKNLLEDSTIKKVSYNLNSRVSFSPMVFSGTPFSLVCNSQYHRRYLNSF